ncbi:MAG: FtsH protease activity modulator HflK, partial [Rhizobiales bacterium]|nr:FtsH protease activity modulator HflK [Hyphomicrobiales bacterium]
KEPDVTVKAVAESAMREVIGSSDIQPILTQARQITETAVQEVMQASMDGYAAGIRITQVQMLKVDPPGQVIDAFRDVQAARADAERSQNEAQAYANRVLPEARGESARILENAAAYKEQTVADADGQADRFISIYEQYVLAPEVTRKRMFLETMERVFSATNKVIIESGIGGSGVVPYLPLNELNRGNK